MRNYILILIFAGLCPSSIFAQKNYCTTILDSAKHALEQDSIPKAIKELANVELCDYNNRLLTERRNLRESIFDKIQQQKEKTERLLRTEENLRGIAFEQEKKLTNSEASFILKENASKVLKDNPTLALLYGKSAMDLAMEKLKYYFREFVEKIYRENNFYKQEMFIDDKINAAFFSRDGKGIIVYTDHKTKVFDLKGRLLKNSRKLGILSLSDDIIPFTNNMSNKIYLQAFDSLKTRNIINNYKPTNALLSPDGDFILTSADNMLRLWSTKNDSYVDFEGGHSKNVNSMAFSQSGDRILTGGEDGKAILWNRSGEVLKVSDCWFKPESVAFSPDGNKFLCTSYSEAVIFSEKDSLSSPLNSPLLKGHSQDVLSAIFSPDGKTILTCSKDKTVCSWDLNRQILETFKSVGNTHDYTFIAFSPNGESFLTVSNDSIIRLWDLNILPSKARRYNENLELDTAKKSIIYRDTITNVVNEIPFSETERKIVFKFITNDGKKIVFAKDDTTYYTWNLEEKVVFKFGSFSKKNSIATSGILPGSNFFSIGSFNKNAYVFNMTKDTLPILFKGHSALVKGIDYSPRLNMLVTASGDKTARLWNMKGDSLKSFPHPHEVAQVAFSPDGKRILTSCYDLKIRLWDIAQAKILMEFDEPVGVTWALSFSPDGSKITTYSVVGKATDLWNINDGIKVLTIRGSSPYTFSRDDRGETILTNSSNNCFRRLPLPLDEFLAKMTATKTSERYPKKSKKIASTKK